MTLGERGSIGESRGARIGCLVLLLAVACTESPELIGFRRVRAELVQLKGTYPLLAPHLAAVIAAADSKRTEAGRAESTREQRKRLRDALAMMDGPVAGRLREIHGAFGRVSAQRKEIAALRVEDPSLAAQLAKETLAAAAAVGRAREMLAKGPVPQSEEDVSEFLLSIHAPLLAVDRSLQRWIKTARALPAAAKSGVP